MSEWVKSSFSNGNGGNNCVEVAPVYRGTTQEVHSIAIRDSKDGLNGPMLVFTVDEWYAFLDGVKAGEFG